MQQKKIEKLKRLLDVSSSTPPLLSKDEKRELDAESAIKRAPEMRNRSGSEIKSRESDRFILRRGSMPNRDSINVTSAGMS
mmetsp:Transcript_28643/g.38183  ORF Transcript_28643/g.38183 Transcript_28643/m.38183 type:complete len:81 (+) Transcript_28643:699-941(+)